MTLRTIFIAIAAPTSAPAASTLIAAAAQQDRQQCPAAGPDASMGVLCRSGSTGAMTATSTKRARSPTMRAASRLRCGETELTSR